MTEASEINISISTGDNSSSKFSRMVTLERVIAWINRQGLDDFTTKGLIEAASRYPTTALPSFRKNFNLMLQRVRAKRKKEQGEETFEKNNIEITPIKENISLDEAFKIFKPQNQGNEENITTNDSDRSSDSTT